jgi:hypothetical protein
MILGLIFYSLALAITVLVTWYFYSSGVDFLGAVFFGAGAGVLASYVLCQISYFAVMKITRGAPFHVGDTVKITDGEHQGQIGKVENLCEGRTCVGVSIETGDGAIIKETLDWVKIRKVRAKQAT